MSSATYDWVEVLEVDGTTVGLLLGRVPEPPFDDPVTKGLALMLIRSATSEAPSRRTGAIEEVSLDALMGQPRPADLIDRYIESTEEVARRNEAPDFYRDCDERFGGDHDAYCAYFRKKDHLFQLELRVVVTSPRWIEHLEVGPAWDTRSYAPEIYDPEST
ncbi:MAG: hypothetical protein AAGE52_37130 [Myxococcota bacterium]